MNETFVRSLSVEMPEELTRLKWAGYFDEFKQRAAYHLARPDLPDIVKERIQLEIRNADVLRREYTLTEEDVIAEIAAYCPRFGAADFEKLRGDADFAFIDGQKRYAAFSTSSLFITSKLLRNWPGSSYPEDTTKEVSLSRDAMRKNGKAAVDTDISYICAVTPEAAKGHRLTVHLPYPNPQGIGVDKIKIVSASASCLVAPETAPQRTACFTADGDDTREFSVRVKARFALTYKSTDDLIAAARTVTDAEEQENRKAVPPAALAEKPPHYVFSPFIRALSDKIIKESTLTETDKEKPEYDILLAHAIYEYIIRQYAYAYVRDYAIIDNLPEYFALRGRGDCGLQASLFITLCRANGIPALWQSGICTDGTNGGMHDWAAVWCRGTGFRPVDCSFGGGALRRASKEDAAFYFGNIDPYRMIFAVDIQEPFNPPKKFYRIDPYDLQIGEAETEESMLEPPAVSFKRIIHSKSMQF